MQRCREQNVKLNKAKVKLRCGEVLFLGHLITKDSLKADPAKIRAVLEMPTPTDVASVCQFIGFTNYLSKFLPRLSDVCESLRKLTLPEVEWFWTNLHDSAVRQVNGWLPTLQFSNILFQQRASPCSATCQTRGLEQS